MSPDEIGSMSRPEIVELLAKNGYDLNPDSDLTLEQLRAHAINVILFEDNDSD